MKKRFFLGVVLTLLSISSAAADSRLQPLADGMSEKEVLGMWGAPLDREERETKRESLWFYPGRAVVAFQNGRVQRWNNGEPARSAIPLSPAMVAQLDGANAAKTSRNPDTVSETDMQAILDEIVERSNAAPAQPGAAEGRR